MLVINGSKQLWNVQSDLPSYEYSASTLGKLWAVWYIKQNYHLRQDSIGGLIQSHRVNLAYFKCENPYDTQNHWIESVFRSAAMNVQIKDFRCTKTVHSYYLLMGESAMPNMVEWSSPTYWIKETIANW